MWPAIVTGIFTLLAGWGGYLHSDFKKKKSVKKAILAEMAAIIEVAEERGLRDAFQAGADGDIPSLRFDTHESYRVVFDGNVSNIGLLDSKDAEKIVRFYQLSGSIVISFKEGGTLTAPTDRSREAFAETLRLYDEAMAVGKTLLKENL